jgi:phosphoribosylformylglycinamidine (FGAM) synthase-like amidotransferase family enzyme
MTPQERQEFEEMKIFIQSLKNSATIPFDVDTAFTDRLNINALEAQTAKTPTSEDLSITVGLTTYTPLGSPNGFQLLNDNGIIKYFPYYL